MVGQWTARVMLKQNAQSRTVSKGVVRVISRGWS